MQGALSHLLANRIDTTYDITDPQRTLFRSIYKRHTNFAKETLAISPIGDVGFGRSHIFEIDQIGDLIYKCILEVTIGEVDPSVNLFAWVNRLGHAIISDVSITLGGTIMDTQTGIWMDISHILNRNVNQDEAYDIMIGDVPELVSYNSDTKPEYTLYIPLQFWWNKNTGSSIPIFIMQHQDARITVNISNESDVTIKDCNAPDTLVGEIVDMQLLIDYVYLDDKERKLMATSGHRYFIEQVQYNGIEILTNDKIIDLSYRYSVKEIIWAMNNVNYLNSTRYIYYTDNNNWHNAVNEASQKIIQDSISTTPAPNAGVWNEVINNNTLVSLGTISVRNNGTQSIYVNQNSLFVDTTRSLTQLITASIVVDTSDVITTTIIDTALTISDLSIPHANMIDTRHDACDPLVNQFGNYGVLIDGSINPFDTSFITFDGHRRVEEMDNTFFNLVQSYLYHKNKAPEGVNIYSFSLDPETLQPNGASNMGKISTSKLHITLNSAITRNIQHPAYVFALSYNYMNILNGQAGLAFDI